MKIFLCCFICCCGVQIVFSSPHQSIYAESGPFGNLTDMEWMSLQSTGYVASNPLLRSRSSETVSFTAQEIHDALNASIDWHSTFVSGHRVSTRVKNQGACGSCYIFSVLAVLETLHANATGSVLALSEQAVLDCVSGSNILQCQGGSPYDLAVILQKFKVPLEKDYPYSWTTFSKSQIGKCGAVPGVVAPSKVIQLSFANFKREDVMAAYVHRLGPLQVSIDTRSPAFRDYSSGILDVPYSSTPVLTHGVAIFGYGSQDGVPYWKIKNSWGPQWGEKGYFRMLRGKGLYGVDLDPVGLSL